MKIEIVEYTGQQNVALIQEEKVLANEIYQSMFDNGTAICMLESYLIYMKDNS